MVNVRYIIHVLSDQSEMSKLKSFFINLKTGEYITFDSPREPQFELTVREKEILRFIRHHYAKKRKGIAVRKRKQ